MMKVVMFIGVILASWIMGIVDGDCTAAVMFSLFGLCALICELSEREKN